MPVRVLVTDTIMQRFIVAFLVFLTSAVLSPLSGQSALFQDEPVVRPGDLLNIVVWLEPDLTGEFQVHTSGGLIHPLYRDLRVAGVPYSQLDSVLGAYLSQFREDARFSVEPLLPVVVTGEVLEGGLQTLGPGVTIAHAVTLAGLSDEARFDRVQLIRNRTLYTVDFDDPEAQWALETIRSGDQIIVERQPNFMRDVVAPVTTGLGALSSVVTFILFMSGQFTR